MQRGCGGAHFGPARSWLVFMQHTLSEKTGNDAIGLSSGKVAVEPWRFAPCAAARLHAGLLDSPWPVAVDLPLFSGDPFPRTLDPSGAGTGVMMARSEPAGSEQAYCI